MRRDYIDAAQHKGEHLWRRLAYTVPMNGNLLMRVCYTVLLLSAALYSAVARADAWIIDVEGAIGPATDPRDGNRNGASSITTPKRSSGPAE